MPKSTYFQNRAHCALVGIINIPESGLTDEYMLDYVDVVDVLAAIFMVTETRKVIPAGNALESGYWTRLFTAQFMDLRKQNGGDLSTCHVGEILQGQAACSTPVDNTRPECCALNHGALT